jgi:hypothetical protein
MADRKPNVNVIFQDVHEPRRMAGCMEMIISIAGLLLFAALVSGLFTK